MESEFIFIEEGINHNTVKKKKSCHWGGTLRYCTKAVKGAYFLLLPLFNQEVLLRLKNYFTREAWPR